MKRPRWVRRARGRGYVLDEAVYGRFDPRRAAFGSFERYLGDEAQELEEGATAREREWAGAGVAGYALRDRALVDAARTVWVSHLGRDLYSWSPIAARGPERYGMERWAAPPGEMAAAVKRAARFLGAALAGVARLDRRHVYSHDMSGRAIVFADSEPIKAKDRVVIPESCLYVVALAIPMPLDTTLQAPDALSSAGVALGYSQMAFVAGSLAEFIRSLGYTALPCGNDTALSVPIAIDAGLGELARTSRLITPEYGPNVRLAKVITDMPLQPDGPIRFGVREFCSRCKICAQKCPAGAISFDDRPSLETRGDYNNPGYQTWYEDAAACLAHWQRVTTGCAVCVRVCPYTKPRGKTFHEMIKAAAAAAPFLGGLFAWADERAGYGRRGSPAGWWRR